VFLQGGDERFPWLAEIEPNLPLHVIGIELNPISNDAIYVPRFGGEHTGVLELDAESQIDAVFCHE
jgi:hypothetical protein